MSAFPRKTVPGLHQPETEIQKKKARSITRTDSVLKTYSPNSIKKRYSKERDASKDSSTESAKECSAQRSPEHSRTSSDRKVLDHRRCQPHHRRTGNLIWARRIRRCLTPDRLRQARLPAHLKIAVVKKYLKSLSAAMIYLPSAVCFACETGGLFWQRPMSRDVLPSVPSVRRS